MAVLAASKPVIHGRDHLPGGADPIPGLHTLIETATPTPAHCLYNSVTGSAITVASGSGGLISWTADGGDTTLLDLTSPTAPAVTVQGVYAVSASFATVSTGWTIGSTYWATLLAVGTDQQSMNSSVTIGAHDLPNGGDAFTGYGHVALAPMDMPVGGTFSLQLNNYDDSSHDLIADQIWVTRLFSY